MELAFLSQGKLHVAGLKGEVSGVKSHFAEKIRERTQQMQDKHAWKSKGRGGMFSGAWGATPQRDPAAMRLDIASATKGTGPGELIYTLDSDDLCAVLVTEQFGAEERRLYHSTDTRPHDLRLHPSGNKIACILRGPMGLGHVGVMGSDGSKLIEVTEGDSVEASPDWVPGEENSLVFQSAGVGRNREGFIVGLAPFVIEQLDYQTGFLETLAEEPGNDLMCPKFDAEGNLHFIRRPYKHPLARTNIFRSLGDLVMAPVRLVEAIGQYLNFFSMRYNGKPLTNAQGAKQKEMDHKQFLLWGNMVDAGRAMSEGRKLQGETPDLVPKTWELIRRAPSGGDKVLASGVLAYDLAKDGSVLFSNGTAIYRLGPSDKKPVEIVRHAFVEQVIAL